MRRISLAVLSIAMSAVASAHHSVAAIYDFEDVREITGTVTAVAWVNPHIKLSLDVAGVDGATESWQLEASAINVLERNGVQRDAIRAGDRITFIGPAARGGRHALAAAVAVMPDGQRISLFTLIASRLDLVDGPKDLAFGAPSAAAAAAAAGATGLFKVWTPRGRPVTANDDNYQQPLTEFARAAMADYDPLVDDPALRCVQAGMPVIIDTPFPVRFSEDGGDIVIRYEEWDGVRTIHMSAGAVAAQRTNMGFSTGRWEGETLVVTTTQIDYPYFDDRGTPQTEALEVVERYTVTADGKRLDWEATMTDPAVFTRPIVFAGNMEWVPGEVVKPFNCTL